MKKELAIGLEGAVINNGNMGCVALTCSLINMLERISDNLAIPFKYYVFEGEKNKEMIESVCKLLEIEKNKILSIPTFHLYRYRAMVHHPIKSIKTLQEMKKCDVFIDLTAGDSFADIYGDYRFNGTTDIKLMIERMGIPLIMGPQTYGPYNKKKNLEKAKKAIDGARCVIARDQMSADYVSKFSSKHVYVTTDLAFGLPFHNITSDSKEKIKIGLNASSLLVKNKTEETETKFKLKTNYDQYLRKLLSILTVDDKYEIHVIPHVERDAGDEIKKEFPNLIYLEPFENPISAKNYISQMDIFIGARMHATIGAFSAGVATIPTAYSRKFKGLYENLEYRYVVDLAALDTMDAVKLTVDYVEHYRELKFAVDKSLIKVNQKTELTYQILHEQLKSLSEKI